MTKLGWAAALLCVPVLAFGQRAAVAPFNDEGVAPIVSEPQGMPFEPPPDGYFDDGVDPRRHEIIRRYRKKRVKRARFKADPEARKIMTAVMESERKLDELSFAYRDEEDANKRKELEGELVKAANDAFDAKMAAREFKIRQMQEEIETAKAEIKKRKKLKAQVVEKKVKQLTGEEDSLDCFVRKNRETLYLKERKYSVRQVAARIGVQPSYLSKVERGEQPPPSEETIVKLAKDLGQDADVLLALGGKISSDLKSIISKRPKLFAQLIRDLKSMPNHAVLRLVREVRDGNW